MNKLIKTNMSSQLPSNTSNTKFGIFISTIFAIIAAYSYLQSFNYISTIAFFSCVFFFVITIASPNSLMLLNSKWYQLGIFLGKFINPIVLGFLFFLIITPIAQITRLFGRDELRINKLNKKSYWLDRLPEESPSNSFKNQF